jgi:2-keto-3-deoxy-galactonokinase
MVSSTPATALLALDWGSSHLRAFRLDAQGGAQDQRASADGASRLQGGAPAFEAALRRLAGDWLQPGVPVLACGMVGSVHGWREADYVSCPIGLDALHHHLATVVARDGLRVHIVPGVSGRDAGGLPDVMRGEETQLAGLLSVSPGLAERSTVVMPGTHSKWVRLQSGRLQAFSTRMTGELFALLREHSVLARLMASGEGFDSEAFDRGVAAAREAGGQDLGWARPGPPSVQREGARPVRRAAGRVRSGLFVRVVDRQRAGIGADARRPRWEGAAGSRRRSRVVQALWARHARLGAAERARRAASGRCGPVAGGPRRRPVLTHPGALLRQSPPMPVAVLDGSAVMNLE